MTGLTGVPEPAEIAARLRAHRPYVAPPIEPSSPSTVPAGVRWTEVRRAAVAVLIAPGDAGPEVLFIERARHEGDHWSGDIAFPGGRFDAGDPDIEHTARRETLEEVGVVLPAQSIRLDDFDARSGRRPWPLVVTPFAYVLTERPTCQTNYEVADVLWAPISQLIDPSASASHTYGPRALTAPAIRLDHRVVWGMTHRMLEQFLGAIGLPLPERSRSARI